MVFTVLAMSVIDRWGRKALTLMGCFGLTAIYAFMGFAYYYHIIGVFRSKFDFVGGYEEHIGAGLLHVADHHVSPGKKQWTWGNGDFGQAWDCNLTDEDGPYIELMTGVYTDNQPDFTWLQPYEEKPWKQYFMPYSEVGYVKNATKDAILHVSVAEGNGKLILYTTSEMKNLCVKVVSVKTGQVLLEETIARIAPEAPYAKVFEAPEVADADMKTVVLAADGVKLLEYQADQPEIKPVPDPARAAKDPKDIASIEQLFLTGLHLEQYRHATYNPLDYYEEALRCEPGDVRCNNAVGLWLMRKGQFAKAEPYFKKAIETLTERNPNPYDVSLITIWAGAAKCRDVTMMLTMLSINRLGTLHGRMLLIMP